ncbi:RNA pseudouridylate synthase domain-containing protein 2 [Coregonus clupeaformis]|uniref:RNA pseudouridylate synthase domain-containing protein 2 n=1 Tax=Coregonus clupeaformis TaxID=59861 RepID=UPI001E1C5F97|nr:RNA pseudouridylate synthase domain-containing protein 2 [Coregonus clupeaformis]
MVRYFKNIFYVLKLFNKREITLDNRTVSRARRCSAQLTNVTNDRDVICKVTKEHTFYNSVNELSSGPRLHQHRFTVVSHTMESTEVTRVSAVNTSNTTVASTTDELKETCKRKSEEKDDPEKSSRGKRRRGGGGKKQLRPGERYIPPPQKRNPGVSFSKEHFDETTYYFEGGLRKVHPYYFDFKTYCKGRWIGKSLLEVFSSEFRAQPLEYYIMASKLGRIRLNETPVDDLSVTLRNNDFLRNTVHRHEPPVVGRPLEILEDNGEVLVVDKPASMPVHPCGRFRHNTVIFILGKERGICGLHTVHRLDRLTSGVLLFARTLEVSQKLDVLVRDRQLEKEYVCRVEGEFPEGEIICEEPILVVSFKVGLCRVHPKGKDCRTVFQRLSWNGHSSVVRCLPLTGRTHQIRVHLQFLGYPILNDPVYGSSAWGPQRAKGGLVGMSDEELLKAILEEHRLKESLHLLDIPDEGMVQVSNARTDVYGKDAQTPQPELLSGVCNSISSDCTLSDVEQSANQVHSSPASPGAVPRPSEENGDQTESTESSHLAATNAKDPLCGECKIVRPDPTEKELVMYLHALRYKGPDFEYSTRLPDWAKDDWIED